MVCFYYYLGKLGILLNSGYIFSPNFWVLETMDPKAQYGHFEKVSADVMLSLGKTSMNCHIILFNLVSVYGACSRCAHCGGHWNFTVNNTNSLIPSIEFRAQWRIEQAITSR